MRIKQKTSQHRRDFTAVYACEHCDHEVEGRGYDDANFHANVIPFAPCPECNKIAPETAPRTAPARPGPWPSNRCRPQASWAWTSTW